MFLEENSASIYLQGMRDRSMRCGTKFAREIQLTDWATGGNLSNRASGVQIPRDILYSFRALFVLYKVQLDNKGQLLAFYFYFFGSEPIIFLILRAKVGIAPIILRKLHVAPFNEW